MTKGDKMPHSVIAAARDDARFKAVEVRKQDNVVEVLWAKSLPADSQAWTALAAACGIRPSPDGHDRAPRKHSASVVGLDSTGVGFYRVTAPAVEQQEMAAIVRMQAESLLPLPPDQMEIAWRTRPSTNGNVDITIAAARREYLRKFAGNVRDFRPGSIVLSCEGTAKAWQSLFSDREPNAVLVSIGTENTQVCLVENGEVAHAAVLGTRMADLASSGDHDGQGQQNDMVEQFAQDMKTILESFGWDASKSWPILLLSDGGEALNRVVELLNAAELPAKASVPDARNLKMPAGFTTQDIYEYRTPLGLSLIALEKPSRTLDLFERITEQEEQEKAISAWRSVILAGAVAAAVLVALIVTVYLTDVAGATRWADLVARPEFEAARQHQTMLKTVARHRPDALQLLADINAGANDGIVLDSLHFKKGTAVTITGQAGTVEQMWKFESSLRGQKAKGFETVNILNQAADPKTKKIKFTITFNYRSFSRKDAVL